MSQRSRKYCSVYGCLGSTLANPELSFFRIPSAHERRLEWVQLIGREDLINPSQSVVCAEHFRAEDILIRKARKVLKRHCLPSLHLPALKNHNNQTTSEDKKIKIYKEPEATAVQRASSSKTLAVSNTDTFSIETDKSDNKTRRRSRIYCSVYGCLRSSLEDPELSYFRVPSAPERRNEWLKRIGRSDLLDKTDLKSSSYRVCSIHFENSMILSVHMRKLLPEAVPTKFPTATQPSSSKNETESDNRIVSAGPAVSTQTEDSMRDPGYGAILKAATTIREPCTVCCVFGCQNSVRDQPDKFYFAFPTEPERCLNWLQLINRGDLAKKLSAGKTDQRVCSDHFDSDDFDGVTLRAEAMPHLKLPAKGSVECVNYSGGAEEIKIEPPDDPNAMEVEIHFEPEAPPTIVFNDPVVPQITRVEGHNVNMPMNREMFNPSETRVTPMNIENIDIPPIQVNKNLLDSRTAEICNPITVENIEIPAINVSTNIFAAKPADVDPLKAREAFFKNATISCVEHISLPSTESAETVETKSVLVQTTKDLIDKMNVPLKKKYQQELKEANEKLKMVEAACKDNRMDERKFLESCDVYLDEKIASIVKSHASLLEKSKGNRYSQNFKVFALNLYLCSPQSYKFVQQFFYLPSMTTIHRFQTPVRTGFNENLMQSLQVKVEQMSEKEKICTVCFDYMEVNKNLYYDVKHDLICGLHEIDQEQGTEPAKYALVIMVRGLYAKWKQPVSFALVAEKKCYPAVKQWLYKTIAKLFDLNLNVKAFTTNQETEFLDLSDISVTESYIEVCGRKIYHFFDVPFLFKSARDDLLKYDFHFGNKVAKLSHILEVYDADKQQELRLMPKITDQHLRPIEASENDVKLSIEVFSRAVAAAMNFHVNANLVHSSTADTVEFIQLMNNLFDVMNSVKTSSENEFKKAYKGTEEQNDFLRDASGYLQQLQMVDKLGNLIEKRSFVTGLLITMKSLQILAEDLQKENLKYLHTKNLSKDCMEGYFKRVRELAGTSNARPTSIMFARSFKRLFLMNLVSNAKKGGTEIDLKSTIAKIADYVKLDVDWKKEDEAQDRSLRVGVSDYHQLWPAPPTDFIAGYLLWKCIEKHKCQTLVETLCCLYNIDVNADLLLEKFKKFHDINVERKDLPPLPLYFMHFVDRLDKIFKELSVVPGVDMFNFGGFMYSKMEADTFVGPCECFPMKFVKFLFIRIKIFHMVKEYNLKNKPTRRSRSKK